MLLSVTWLIFIYILKKHAKGLPILVLLGLVSLRVLLTFFDTNIGRGLGNGSIEVPAISKIIGIIDSIIFITVIGLLMDYLLLCGTSEFVKNSVSALMSNNYISQLSNTWNKGMLINQCITMSGFSGCTEQLNVVQDKYKVIMIDGIKVVRPEGNERLVNKTKG